MPAAIEKAKPVALLIFGSAAVTAICCTLFLSISALVRGTAPMEGVGYYFFWFPFSLTGVGFLIHSLLFAVIVALGGVLNWRRRGEVARTYAIGAVTFFALLLMLQLYTGDVEYDGLSSLAFEIFIFGCPFVVALALQRQSPTPA